MRLKERGDFLAPARFPSSSNRFGHRCSALKSSGLAALHFFWFGAVMTVGEVGAWIRPRDG